MRKYRLFIKMAWLAVFVASMLIECHTADAVTPTEYQALPVIGATSEPPLVMLVLGRNHKLFYEAYNDASDLNEDGILDVGYNPDIEYYGYFDSYKVYTYSSANQRFEPLRESETKKVDPGANNEWSGDFLNYLTMSRMDAIRKVLYGGYRSTDTTTTTVLERAYIPQDAHTWGKEYESVERDGYDIRDYTPLDLPQADSRHLFASTSLTDPSNSSYKPLLRVLPNNGHRIWEWVSKEHPVADSSLESSGGAYNQHPDNHDEYESMVDMFANASHFQGSDPPANGMIDGSGNPHGPDDDYLTIFTGNITVNTGGTYWFAVDGDDAVEVIVDGVVVAGYYGGHGHCGCTSHNGSIELDAGMHAIEFRHEEDGGGDDYHLGWKGPDTGDVYEMIPAGVYSDLMQTNYNLNLGASTITDYAVRVQVGVSSLPETNCKLYKNNTTGSSVYKPIGLLQRYGEPERMFFGLMTGSYTKNTSGGVLRKNVGDIKDEINQDTGQFTAFNGIIQSINKLRIVDFSYSGYSYNSSCGWVATRAINEGECRMWGNPVGEMMYETLRYFAGKGSPTSAFTYGADSGYDDNELGLPKPAWEAPYDSYPYCAKPFMLVLSDINPTYDSDQLPGSAFGSFSGDLIGLDVEALGNAIGTTEGELGNYYIGQKGATYDGACTSKTVTNGLGDIRGLCPEEPTKKGSYYSASVAYYGHMNDISPVQADQLVNTFAVGLASPLPEIKIPIGNQEITLVPFAKSVGGYSISANQGAFQPTNTIVDFYVDTIAPTYGKFRINFEDVEQGADHDMDAIIIYEYQVVDGSGNPVETSDQGVSVKIKLTSEYASGSIIQHCGYIISGTTQDGTYLEVRDADTAASSDPDYFLDTPPGELPGGDWDDNTALGLVTPGDGREFTPGGTTTSLLKNPLWYAGKWGGFEDQNDNDLPDLDTEWDSNVDGIPDNYFYVTNPLRLEEQLNASFSQIAAKSASGTSASVLATTNEGDGTLIQAYFRPLTTLDTDEIRWMGFLQSLWVDSMGFIREDTNGNLMLDTSEDRVLVFKLMNGETRVRRYDVDEDHPYPDIETDGYMTIDMADVIPIWEAGNVLANTDASDRNIFTTPTGGESDLISFSEASVESIKDLLGVSDADIALFPDANIEFLGADQDTRARNLISFIRGSDADGLRNRTIDEKVWKLGDIVYSTPTSVARQVERYHIIYDDESYSDFFRQSALMGRQTVVYAGGNDGMLHAFSSWYYDSDTNSFSEPMDMLGNQGETIGDELWAYIPRSILPHLKWLSDPEYVHSYFVDLTPKIFDAKIAGPAHDQWGTFLLLGLNMGGKDIVINVDTDGDGTPDATETLKPSYSLLDITDPTDPKLMWERTYEGLGMSRSMPAIIKIGGYHFGDFDIYGDSGETEKWLAVFGSGPHGDFAYDGISDQPGRIYVVDLKTGNAVGRDGHDYLFTTSANAVVNSPISIDKALTYEVNSIYFGEAIIADPANPLSGWSGRAWSIDTFTDWEGTHPDTGEIDPNWWEVANEPTAWHLHLLLEEFQPEIAVPPVPLGPITAPMAVSMDELPYDNVWVYFGTGRYISEDDKQDATPQHLLGIKDPLYNAARDFTSPAYVVGDGQVLDPYNLLKSSRYRVRESDYKVEEMSGVGAWSEFGTFGELLELIRQDNTYDASGDLVIDNEWRDGWSRNLAVSEESPPLPSERCLSKSAILGGGLFVPTYTPSEEECMLGGTSNLYGLYYETGTAYVKPLVPSSGSGYFGESISLGEGAPPPIAGIHVGRKQGGKAFLQMSTGEIIETEIDSALPIKSRFVNWFEDDEIGE